jgi:hypothetical protein
MAHNTALKSIISSPRVVPAKLGDHALLRLQALQGPNQHDVRRLSHPVTPWGFIPQCRAIGARRFLDFFPSGENLTFESDSGFPPSRWDASLWDAHRHQG